MLFLDACAIIYLLEAVDKRGDKVRSLVHAYLDTTNSPLLVSSLSLLECRILPKRERNAALLTCYDNFFNSEEVYMIELSHDILHLATDLRASYIIRTPDAIQVACALHHHAHFVTGDKRLSSIPSLPIILV